MGCGAFCGEQTDASQSIVNSRLSMKGLLAKLNKTSALVSKEALRIFVNAYQ